MQRLYIAGFDLLNVYIGLCQISVCRSTTQRSLSGPISRPKSLRPAWQETTLQRERGPGLACGFQAWWLLNESVSESDYIYKQIHTAVNIKILQCISVTQRKENTAKWSQGFMFGSYRPFLAFYKTNMSLEHILADFEAISTIENRTNIKMKMVKWKKKCV